MPFELAYDDLISVPLGHRLPGIYWLRLYRSADADVTVVTEVPGNPSFSVTNGISGIISYVQREFQLKTGDLTTYLIWPRGAFEDKEATVEKIRLDGKRWDEVTRQDIERHVGARLTELPAHNKLYSKVVALGGGVTQDVYRNIFEAIPATSLPSPHNPSNCLYIERMREMEEETGDDLAQEEGSEIGRRFIASLTPDEVRKCRYHDANWKKIADEGCRLIDTLGRVAEDDYVNAARASKLRKKDRGWLVSLFSDPVFIGGGGYTNGQHRACALRFSGADRVPVSIGDELLGQECVDWTYAGEG